MLSTMQSLGELRISESWVFCGAWWATLRSWHRQGAHSNTAVPKQRRVVTLMIRWDDGGAGVCSRSSIGLPWDTEAVEHPVCSRGTWDKIPTLAWGSDYTPRGIFSISPFIYGYTHVGYNKTHTQTRPDSKCPGWGPPGWIRPDLNPVLTWLTMWITVVHRAEQTTVTGSDLVPLSCWAKGTRGSSDPSDYSRKKLLL